MESFEIPTYTRQLFPNPYANFSDLSGAVLGFLPTLLVFVLMQRYIIRGISLSGVKG